MFASIFSTDMNFDYSMVFKKIKPFLLAQLALFLLAIAFDFLIVKYNLDSGFDSADIFSSKTQKIILVIVFAPLIETLIFNLLVNEFLMKFLDYKLIIFFSSMLFAIIHFYSLYYALYAFFGGIIFNFIYFKYRYSALTSYLIVTLLHLNHNLLGLLFDK